MRKRRSKQGIDKNKVKKRVWQISLAIIIFAVVYFFLFSQYYKVQYIEIVGNQAINTNEIETLIWQELDKNILLFFNKDNFWLLSVNNLITKITDHYSFEDITITKKYPNTLSLRIKERLGKMIWKSADNYYVVDAKGVVSHQLKQIHLLDELKTPVINDYSNEEVEIGQNVLSDSLIQNIIDVKKIYSDYIVEPKLEIKEIVVDNKNANFYKIITVSDVELHLNDNLSALKQILKLQTVLKSNRINLNSINYINLRVGDQVIYK